MSEEKPGRRSRSYRQPLDPEWVRHLLFASPEAPTYQCLQLKPDLTSLATLLKSAREILATAVSMAQEELARHPLVEAVAREAARRASRRTSKPRIVVDDDGQVMLEIAYVSTEADKVEPVLPKPSPPPPSSPRVVRSRKSDLPSLDELRREAARLGVDITACGRAKKRIQGLIKQALPADPAPIRPKMVKTAPAVGPVRVVEIAGPSLSELALLGAKVASSLEDADFLAGIED